MDESSLEPKCIISEHQKIVCCLLQTISAKSEMNCKNGSTHMHDVFTDVIIGGSNCSVQYVFRDVMHKIALGNSFEEN